MGLILKCKKCGKVCTDDYAQTTHYKNKHGEVIGVYCSTRCIVEDAGVDLSKV